MNDATDILDYLAANGFVIGYRDTGAIRLPNGRTAFVRERVTNRGVTQIVIDHPPHGGRAGFYTQRFTSRERALRARQGASK